MVFTGSNDRDVRWEKSHESYSFDHGCHRFCWGGALALELLQRTDAELYCLVRPRATDDDIQRRLEQGLSKAAGLYGLPHLKAAILDRCRAISGDILKPRAGLGPIPRVDEVWHAAASLKFGDEHRSEIWSHNVDGTCHLLDLARASHTDVFNYISTAYVAGQRQGLILEELIPPETPTNNAYEDSKIVAEHLVAQSGLYHRIFRPSIVIGHSQTLAATNVYGILWCDPVPVGLPDQDRQAPRCRFGAHTFTDVR